MVRPNSQHKCSSCRAKPRACARTGAMADGSRTAAAAAAIEPTADGDSAVPAVGEEARQEEELGGGPSASDGRKQLRQPVVVTPADGTILPEIQRLKQEQKALQEQKKAIQKDLRNAERRRSRLKKRARQLSDEDLVAVFQLRQQEKIVRTDAQSESAAASASAGAGRPPCQQ